MNTTKSTPSYDYSARNNGRAFVSPHPHDVLCGRGKDCFRHDGNVHFRFLIGKMLPQYVSSDSKKHKMQIIRLVVNKIVEGGGRFLKKDVRHNQWYDGGVVCGKDKVGHSFRDAKGQGRRKSSKVLQNLNEGNQDDAGVAALSEENRGAVALAAFKMGFQGKKATTDESRQDDEDTTKDEDVHAASSLLFLRAESLERTVKSPGKVFHQPCATFVPQQTNVVTSSSLYFI